MLWMSQRLLWKANMTGACSVKSALNDMLSMPCGWLSGIIRAVKSTTLTTRTLMPGTCFCRSHAAAQFQWSARLRRKPSQHPALRLVVGGKFPGGCAS
jgi:hypothetical protein